MTFVTTVSHNGACRCITAPSTSSHDSCSRTTPRKENPSTPAGSLTTKRQTTLPRRSPGESALTQVGLTELQFEVVLRRDIAFAENGRVVDDLENLRRIGNLDESQPA